MKQRKVASSWWYRPHPWTRTRLCLIFPTLKVCGYLDWSWWYVTAPFWGGYVALAAIIAALWVWENSQIVSLLTAPVWVPMAWLTRAFLAFMEAVSAKADT